MLIRILQRFLLVILLFAGLPGPPRALAQSAELHGGVDASTDITKYKYIVKLTNESGETLCNGIALGNYWVLTAAHCALKSTLTRADPFGSVGPTKIVNRYKRSDYSNTSSNTQNDLALLETECPLRVWWTGGVGNPGSRDSLIVFGWVRVPASGGGFITKLHKSKPMPLRDSVKCDSYWTTQVIDTNELCAGALASSACNGDSGGPLFIAEGSGLAWEPKTLVGILSKADNSCDATTLKGIYDIYTMVKPFSTWITKVTSNAGSARSPLRCP